MITTKRRRISRKKYDGFFLTLKLALICYLVIFSISYMSSGTSAYLSSQAEFSQMITAAWEPVTKSCGEVNESEIIPDKEITIGTEGQGNIPLEGNDKDAVIFEDTSTDGENQVDMPEAESGSDLPSDEEKPVDEAQIDIPQGVAENNTSSGNESTIDSDAQIDIPSIDNESEEESGIDPTGYEYQVNSSTTEENNSDADSGEEITFEEEDQAGMPVEEIGNNVLPVENIIFDGEFQADTSDEDNAIEMASGEDSNVDCEDNADESPDDNQVGKAVEEATDLENKEPSGSADKEQVAFGEEKDESKKATEEKSTIESKNPGGTELKDHEEIIIRENHEKNTMKVESDRNEYEESNEVD